MRARNMKLKLYARVIDANKTAIKFTIMTIFITIHMPERSSLTNLSQFKFLREKRLMTQIIVRKT